MILRTADGVFRGEAYTAFAVHHAARAAVSYLYPDAPYYLVGRPKDRPMRTIQLADSSGFDEGSESVLNWEVIAPVYSAEDAQRILSMVADDLVAEEDDIRPELCDISGMTSVPPPTTPERQVDLTAYPPINQRAPVTGRRRRRPVRERAEWPR